ncbi:MAG: MerR family transcriptional regulator [Ktedonobacteraceae bacterium]|nr:MerR family transcriptional regulator [Ktedonobacteraceae bacterium]MBO0793453.1 MerR family transcriptional regulator [Ktedonobacteraceae bacterium]
MFIGELAKKTGLTSHTIRFYEEEGLLDEHHVRRGANNYRYYSLEAVERLMLIKQAQSTGFTIAELKELAEAYDAGSLTKEQQVASLRRKVADISSRIAELQQLQTSLLGKLALMEQAEPTSAPQDHGAD